MAMSKERKRLYDVMRKKYGYFTSSTRDGYSELSRITSDGKGEIHVVLVPQVNSDPVVVLKSHATIGINELITLGKIAEEFKKEMEAENSKIN